MHKCADLCLRSMQPLGNMKGCEYIYMFLVYFIAVIAFLFRYFFFCLVDVNMLYVYDAYSTFYIFGADLIDNWD